MVDLGNDIDDVFRQRFEGLKDFSTDPSIGWSAVEAGMAQSSVLAAATSSSAGVILFKAAAIIGSLMVVVGLAQSDGPIQPEDKFEFHLAHSNPLENHVIDEVIPSDGFARNDAIKTSPLNVIHTAQSTSESSIAESVTLSNSPVVMDSELAVITWSGQADAAFNKSNNKRIFTSIPFMPSRVKSYTNPIIASRNDIMEEPVIEHWSSNHIWYLRGALRIGSGESNSFEVESKWKANPSFAFGYGFSLSDRSYITTEIGWLRRSGNGIERTRDIDLDPIITSLTGTGSADGTSYLIHESLVATRMDYVHVPVTYNELFNDNWSVSIGGFCDYLISAENEGYVVYDNTQYRASVTGKTELNSKDGLNKFRYGALLGAERHLGRQLSAFGNMMVPLNSAVDASSDYRVIDETNRLIDLQIGLIYRI
jgi:hypothetical protein